MCGIRRGLLWLRQKRDAPLSVAGYQRMVARAGEAVGFGFLVHSHMLRHGCGYKLANDGQDTRAIQHYLGHRSIAPRPCAIPRWQHGRRAQDRCSIWRQPKDGSTYQPPFRGRRKRSVMRRKK
jgi:Phage integrase family